MAEVMETLQNVEEAVYKSPFKSECTRGIYCKILCPRTILYRSHELFVIGHEIVMVKS